ncbi:TetR/AcrR family transcriptional regulator [Paraburkholderia strydomiana]
MSLREQQKQITQARLLQAAIGVFMERGYADATVDDIVEAASVGRATFYLHYKSKLEVMRALIRTMERENEELIEEFRSYEQPTRESLESWLRRFVAHSVEEGDRFLVGLRALASEPELSGEFEAGIGLATGALSKLLIDNRVMAAAEAHLRATLLVGALQQACRTLVSEPDTCSAALVVRVISDIWASSLGL